MGRLKTALKKVYGALPFKQPVYTALRNTVHVPEPIYRHLHFKGVIKVPISATEGLRIRHHGYMIENELFWKGMAGFEPVCVKLWIRLCKQARMIFDVGANTGLYALTAKAVNPGATVVAVEAVQRVFQKLQGNIALNPWEIHAVHAAANDRTGTAILYDIPENAHVLSVSLNPEWNQQNTRLRPVEVPCITVADLAAQYCTGPVDLLKIDVESHEPAVLRGFTDILQRDRPSMLIEILNDDVAAQVSGLLAGLGYVYYNIDDKTWPPPRVERLTQSGHYNFLVCQPEMAEAIGL